jgi:DNA-binding NarL/FixJ family response regulator
MLLSVSKQTLYDKIKRLAIDVEAIRGQLAMKLGLERRRSVSEIVRILIVHPTPVVRLGIAKALEEVYSPGEIDAFADLAAIDSLVGSDAAFSAALIDAHEWGARACSGNLADIPVGLISAAGSTPCNRLMRARGLKGIVAVTAGAVEFLKIANALVAGEDYFPGVINPARFGLARLSRRQFEILELMTGGLLNKQIAGQLGVSEATVKAHVSSILVKLNCSRRTQATTAYMRLAGLGGRPVALA